MNCPKCPAAEIKPIKTKEGVEVDFCSECKGIWFEKGELAFYVETSSDLPSKRSVMKEAKESNHNCPACKNKKLLEMHYSKSDDLMLDYCSQCDGIWLDKHEIAKIETLSAKIEHLSKVSDTIKSLESMGYKILEKRNF